MGRDIDIVSNGESDQRWIVLINNSVWVKQFTFDKLYVIILILRWMIKPYGWLVSFDIPKGDILTLCKGTLAGTLGVWLMYA